MSATRRLASTSVQNVLWPSKLIYISKHACPLADTGFHSCSVACSRTHRDNHPPSEPRPPVLEPEVKEKPKDNHPFSVLDGSMELQQLFRKYPNLPSRLKQIYDTTLPPNDESFVKGGLPTKVPPVYASKKNNEPWTQDIGLRRGQQALRQARTDPGEDGDGVREYCELVLYLLSKSEKENDVTELVRQEAVMEDAKLIEKLMQSEGR